MRKVNDRWSGIRWLNVKNTSGEVIPAFGVMQVNGRESTGEFQVIKPTADSRPGCLINGPLDIPIGEYGQGLDDFPFPVLYDTADGTPAAGDVWGPGASSWKLRKGKSGYIVYGNANGTTVEVNKSPNGVDASCTATKKSIVSLFNCSGTWKQQYEIWQGCQLISTACETVPTSGVCCPGPASTCPCASLSPPNYQTFTLSAISNSSCTGCSDAFNGNYCLAQFYYGCQYIGYRAITNRTGCVVSGGWYFASAMIQVYTDGSANLFIGPSLNNAGTWEAVYYISSFSCTGNNTFTKVSDAGNCSGWPSTITTYPASDNSICTNPPAGNQGCSTCAKKPSSITVSFVTDNSCTSCGNINGTWTMTDDGTHCTFTGGTDNPVNCSVSSGATFNLHDNGTTGWELVITLPGTGGTATFYCSYAAWKCTGANNQMTFLSSTGSGCTWATTTITVTMV